MLMKISVAVEDGWSVGSNIPLNFIDSSFLSSTEMAFDVVDFATASAPGAVLVLSVLVVCSVLLLICR